MRFKRALGALVLSSAISACCTPTVVRQPVVVRPPPCLDVPPPVPPTTEDDALWSRYHVALEAFVAYALRACGADEDDGPRIVGPYAD